jgi:hypothetical protein
MCTSLGNKNHYMFSSKFSLLSFCYILFRMYSTKVHITKNKLQKFLVSWEIYSQPNFMMPNSKLMHSNEWLSCF